MILKAKRLASVVLMGAVFGSALALVTWAAEPTTAPVADAGATTQPAPLSTANPPASTQPANGRPLEAVLEDLKRAGTVLDEMLTSPEVLVKQAQREAIKPRAVPALTELLKYADELAAQPLPQAQAQGQQLRNRLVFMLALFDEPSAVKELDSIVKGDDPALAMNAKTAQMMIRWWKASDSDVEQGKILDEMAVIAQTNSEDDGIAKTLVTMSQLGANSPAISERALGIVVSDLKGPEAVRVAQQVNSMKDTRSKLQAHRQEQLAKLAPLVGKPFTVEGETGDGKAFSSEALKGKVIIVDFWATWCAPCVADLPELSKFYADHHDQGLEIVGVSCDGDQEAMKQFLAENKDVTWTQLANTKSEEMHPLATKLGIDMLPAMLIIDRNGVVREVDGTSNFKELVPKLLEEKAQ